MSPLWALSGSCQTQIEWRLSRKLPFETPRLTSASGTLRSFRGGVDIMFSSIQFDEEIKPPPPSDQKDGVTLLIDQMSYQHMASSEVDFTEGHEGDVRRP